MISWIGFILGTVLIFSGLFVVFSSIFASYKFHYVCNRMHATAMQDTLGLLLVLLGLICYSGFHGQTLKIIFVILFFWISSPTCAHLLVRMEVTTNDHFEEEMEVIEK